MLRKRLVISDDLAPEPEAGDSYDAALVDAVKHFQLRHGLEANGSVGPQTLRALDVPVAARIKQLEASLERLLGMDFVFAERYVVVNIPAAFVEAVAHDKVDRRYRVIVGKVDKPSPRSPPTSPRSTLIRPGRCRCPSPKTRSSGTCAGIRLI